MTHFVDILFLKSTKKNLFLNKIDCNIIQLFFLSEYHKFLIVFVKRGSDTNASLYSTIEKNGMEWFGKETFL